MLKYILWNNFQIKKAKKVCEKENRNNIMSNIMSNVKRIPGCTIQLSTTNIQSIYPIKYRFVHPIGYTFFTPNWVHFLCTKLDTYFVYQIGYIFCAPNWVHIFYTQLDVCFVYPIWYLYQ